MVNGVGGTAYKQSYAKERAISLKRSVLGVRVPSIAKVFLVVIKQGGSICGVKTKSVVLTIICNVAQKQGT